MSTDEADIIAILRAILAGYGAGNNTGALWEDLASVWARSSD